MPWFKIDDKHHDHKKTRKALRGVVGKRRDAGAMGLWELAGSWSADNLQDGFVPTDELFRWDDDWEVLSRRLVDADYWEPSEKDGEPGFQFLNWDEHQPTKADVEAKREAARQRMRSARSKGGRGSGEVRANEQANTSRSSDDVRSTPSRPVPSRPDPIEEASGLTPVATPSKGLALVKNDRPDVERICEHLAEQIEARGSKRPEVTARWRNEARLLIDRDKRTEEQVHACIRWLFTSGHKDAQFWRVNVRSMPKLREEYDRLRELAERSPGGSSRNQEQQDLLARAMARAEERERNGA